MKRRTLVRLLVGAGIGVPVVVEGATLVGLVDQQFGDDAAAEEPAETTARATGGATVGDELLPATRQSDRLAAASVRADGGWTLHLAAEVENAGDAAYELRLGRVRTADGDTVEGGGSTGRVPPGETATVAGTWSLPEGATPAEVTVVAMTYADEATGVTSRQVPLGKVPVRGA